MSAHLLERLRTALQDPRTHGDSVQRERLQEVTRLRRLVWDLRREIERLRDDERTCPQCFDYVENCACGRKGNE